jgi:hypothetical protein
MISVVVTWLPLSQEVEFGLPAAPSRWAFQAW